MAGWRLEDLHTATKGGEKLIQRVPVTSGYALDSCSNLGSFQRKMEQKLLGIVVLERDSGIRKSCLLFMQPGGEDTGVCYLIFVPFCMSGIFHNKF